MITYHSDGVSDETNPSLHVILRVWGAKWDREGEERRLRKKWCKREKN